MRFQERSSLAALCRKYLKFSRRLERGRQNGSFWSLPVQARRALARRVERLKARIEATAGNLRTAFLSVGLALGMSLHAWAGHLAFHELMLSPFQDIQASPFSKPVLADLRGAGVPDLFVAEGGNHNSIVSTSYSSAGSSIEYYKNVGTPGNPEFVQETGPNNPFHGVYASYPQLNFVELDGNGVYDAVISGDRYHHYSSNYNSSVSKPYVVNHLRFFKNTGTSQYPHFVEQSGSKNPFNFIQTGNYSSGKYGGVAFADLDGNGTQDMVELVDPRASSVTGTTTTTSPTTTTTSSHSGPRQVTIAFFKNTGTAEHPVFVRQTGAANPFNGIQLPLGHSFGPSNGGVGTPAFVDLDGNGLEDLVVALNGSGGSVVYLKNVGTPTQPAFVQESGAGNPFSSFPVGGYFFGGAGSPCFASLDGNGLQDCVLGNVAGSLVYYKNTGSLTSPSFTQQGVATSGINAFPSLVDIDGDGKTDLFVGSYLQGLQYFKNTGTPGQPAFSPQPASSNPLPQGVVPIFDLPALAFADLGGNGLQDGLVLAKNGQQYYQNQGTATQPNLVKQSGSSDPFSAISISSSYGPGGAFADLDHNGTLDLAFTAGTGVRYFKNTGTASSPAFTELTGTASPFSGINFGTTANSLVFLDEDGDGLDDALVATRDGNIHFLKNVGDLADPRFVLDDGADNPFQGKSFGASSFGPSGLGLSVGDVNGDGIPDLAVGEADGTVLIFTGQQAQAQATPVFAESGMSKPVLAPVPAKVGDPICLYFDKAPTSSTWDLYNEAGARVSTLSFGAQRDQCASTNGLVPGLYVARLKVDYADGSSGQYTQKILIVK